MKKVIWALFDDGCGSWHQCTNDSWTEKYLVISIGINDNDWENYHKIDLRLSNQKLIKELSKLPKPDIIVASPPCESWSNADVNYRQYRQTIDNKIEMHTPPFYDMDLGKMKHYYLNQQSKRLIGEDTALSICKIIEHFNPEFWIIENPQTSKIWEYLWTWAPSSFKRDRWYKNLAYYNCYDKELSKKPTIFLSNLPLILLHFKVITEKTIQNKRVKGSSLNFNTVGKGNNYNLRSYIPKNLIADIIYNIELGEF